MVGKPVSALLRDELRVMAGPRPVAQPAIIRPPGGGLSTGRQTLDLKKTQIEIPDKALVQTSRPHPTTARKEDSSQQKSSGFVVGTTPITFPKSVSAPPIAQLDEDIKFVHIRNKANAIIKTYRIRRWDPRKNLVYNSKVALIGKPGSGKSTAIADICWQFKDFIPVGAVFSGTETENQFYQNFFPSVFISEYYDEKRLLKFLIRQRNLARLYKQAMDEGRDKGDLPDPKALLVLDDLADQGCFDRKLFKTIFKMGRHWHILVILALQNAMDMKPHLRQSIDYLVLFREVQKNPLKSLYQNYAGCIPVFDEFCEVMRTINGFPFTAVVIDNKSQGTNVEDCIYWWKAEMHRPFKFGSREYQLQGELLKTTVEYDPLKTIIKEMKSEQEKKTRTKK